MVERRTENPQVGGSNLPLDKLELNVLNCTMELLEKTFFTTFFDLIAFSGSAELFIGYSLIQLSLYSIFLRLTHTEQVTRVSTSNSLPNYFFFGVYCFLVSFFLLLNEDINQTICLSQNLNNMIVFDQLAFLTKLTVCIFIVLFFVSNIYENKKLSLSNCFEYVSFITASSLGSMLLCSASDFITAYLAVELQSISFYFMSCSKKNSSYSIEGGLKYFIVGSFSSCFFLIGSAFLYASLGTLNFSEIRTILSLLNNSQDFLEFGLVYLGFVCVCFSVLIKLAAAPFHLWSIDVYESSPTVTAYFFAVIPKLGLFVLLTRIAYCCCFVEFSQGFASQCLAFSFLSILIGALGGIEQRRIKSLLAYSSIGHTGYALLSFSACDSVSVAFTLYYLMLYMLSGLSFWCLVVFLRPKSPYNAKMNKELGDLTLLYKSNPMLAVVFGLVTFSLSGIPPLVGFLIKFGAFFSAIQSSAYLFAASSILISVLSTFYYLRIVKVIFFENGETGKLYYPVRSSKSLIITSCSFFLILFFFKPSLFYLSVLKAFLIFK